MIEMRNNNGYLEYRQRSFQIDASGAFCGLSDFGKWTPVPEVETCLADGCESVRPQDVPGPPPVPGPYYCPKHRHLMRPDGVA